MLERIKQIFMKMKILILAFMMSMALIFNPLLSANAGAVAVPVGAELIGELLVALGLMAGNATDGYIWTANDNPYVSSIFENQVKNITSGVPISSDVLGKLSGTVIPENTYTTDGTDFFVGGKLLTTSDVFLSAKSLVGVSYAMPTNIDGAQHATFIDGTAFAKFPVSDFGRGYYFFPYYVTDNGNFVFSASITWNDDTGRNVTTYDFINRQSIDFSAAPYLYYEYITYYWYYTSLGQSSELNGSVSTYVDIPKSSELARVSGTGDFSYKSVTGTSLLRTSGTPVLSVSGDSASLSNSIVQVKPSDDDDNDGSTPPVPQPPTDWQIWQTAAELLDQLDTGNITNGGTTYQDYVNNNYNYVDVDINVPDEINNNVTISGGLDINGSGNVDITIHENISLPSGGDGSGFYNPDAVDAVAALTTDNPVLGLIRGIFSAIDPVFVGIFSVSMSLMVVLGIWKLIRG